MFKMSIGQYLPGDSPVHRMDARVKLVITFCMIIGVFFIHSGWGYLAAALYLGAVMGVSKIRLSFMYKALRSMLFIVILTFAINLFTGGGQGFKVTLKGLELAVTMSLRLVYLIVASQILTLTTSPLALTDGIESLFRPLSVVKFPVHEMAMMMTIAMRFIPTLLDEADRIMKAQMSRGADFESGNLMRRAGNMVPLLVPLFVSAFRRADELAMAMEARCYRGGEGRTRLKQMKITAVDYQGIAVSLILAACIAADFILF
jgi:energy-coupling factor transport system permease protein